MSLLDKIRQSFAPIDPVTPEQDYQVANAVDFQNADSWEVLRGLHDSMSDSGSVVTERTAMRVSAVYACVRLISGAISSLPIDIFKRDQFGEKEKVESDLWWLLNEQPAPSFSGASFWEYLVAQMLLRGDSFCYIVRSPNGKPQYLMPLSRSQVLVERVPTGNPRVPFRLVYYIGTNDGFFGADQDDMLHFPGFGFNGINGMSVIEWGARSSTGIAISADRYAGSYFDSGGQPQHVVRAAGKMGEASQEAFRAAWQAKYGGAKINGVPLILTEGLDISELSVSAQDAQLLESRKWQVIDIARAFGVPPHMVGETTASTSWGSGIEQMGQGFVTYTLTPHLRRIEEELNRKLFRTATSSLEFNVAGLLRGDHTARANYYKAALGGTQNPAWMTPNEIRKLENLPPIEGGDTLSKPESKPTNPESSDAPENTD
jgi:HK97 family phage portal protein